MSEIYRASGGRNPVGKFEVMFKATVMMSRGISESGNPFNSI